MALFLGEHAIDLFAGQPVKSDEETVLESLTATPTTSTQTFLPSIDIDGWNRVTVNPIPSQYIIPSGSTSITQNGTFDISDYASVNVNVPGIVPSGTLNITTNGSHDVTTYVTANVNVPIGQTINNQDKSVTPTESEQSIVADEGYTGLGTVTVEAISSSYVGSGISRRSSSNLTVSGATVTAPAGYYTSSASKTVASGTAGTPSAIKGSVNNHSVSITPSVTNETGYITGGTKNGTAVSVSASQLVSGTLEVTQNGTKDVTNYASVNVNVPSSGGQVLIVDTPDSHGGTIREITAQDTVTLQNVKNYTLTSSSATITPDTGYDGFASLEVISDDREDLTDPKDVDFIDYDGRLIYSYTASEFMNLTALPANPSNAGLVAQGWNWTLEDAQNFVGKYGTLVIGQNYTTDTGRTRIYIHISEMDFDFYNPVTLSITLTSTAKGSPTFYWGDGTSSSWNGTAGGQTGTDHVYSMPGDYIIEIEVAEGETITYLGWNGANNSIFGGDNHKQMWLRKVEIGNNVTGLARNVFKRCANLESVSMPITLLTIQDYDESVFYRGALHNKGLVFPINFTTSRYRAWFDTVCELKYVSIPKGMTSFSIPTYPPLLRKLTMYSLETSLNSTSNIKIYDSYSLTHYILDGTYTTIVTDSCRATRIKKLYIPETVTSIAATAFAYNSYLEEIHLYPTTPPTLANVNAFNSQTSATNTCIFYVPYSEDHSILEAYQTATNWSTFASKMQEEPQS